MLDDLPYPSATDIAPTTWTSCDDVSDMLLRVCSALSGGMNVPLANTGSQPTSEIDMARRFVQRVHLMYDDETTHSLTCPTSRCSFPRVPSVSSGNSALVTLSQVEGDLVRSVPSLHPIPSQTQYIPSGFTSSSWTSRCSLISYTTSTRSSESSARNGLTCCAS